MNRVYRNVEFLYIQYLAASNILLVNPKYFPVYAEMYQWPSGLKAVFSRHREA